MARRHAALAAVLALSVLAAAACGDDDDDDTATVTTAAAGAGDTATTAAGGAGAGLSGPCAKDALTLKEAGKLTVATGEPAFLPWVADDDPTTQQGFEAALTYAIGEQLGFTADEITWTRVGFDEAVAPGPKDFDFNIQQYSITPDRAAVVDFSTGYYTVQQAVVARDGSAAASATSVADLKSVKLGAAIATTSLDYIDDVIQPSTKAAVFDDNAAAKAAFDANQVDGLVFDLPTAYFITSVEIPDAKIVGVLPATGDAEELGAMFEKGSALVPCVNEALAQLEADGTLAALQEEWLNQGGSIPTLTQ
jgi:polar amino acid transport system substrate-binding protein